MGNEGEQARPWITDEEMEALTAGNEGRAREVMGELGKEVKVVTTREVGGPGRSREEELRKHGVTPKQVYKWDEWMDGEYHGLVAGKDFQVSVESFRVMAHNVASRRGGFVWTEAIEGGTILGLQYFKTRIERLHAKAEAKKNDVGRSGLWEEVD